MGTKYDYLLGVAKKIVVGLSAKPGVHIVDKEMVSNWLAQTINGAIERGEIRTPNDILILELKEYVKQGKLSVVGHNDRISGRALEADHVHLAHDGTIVVSVDIDKGWEKIIKRMEE